MEVPTHLHLTDNHFKKHFKLPEVLPGGDWCTMYVVEYAATSLPWCSDPHSFTF
jgi:hypothetical protein